MKPLLLICVNVRLKNLVKNIKTLRSYYESLNYTWTKVVVKTIIVTRLECAFNSIKPLKGGFYMKKLHLLFVIACCLMIGLYGCGSSESSGDNNEGKEKDGKVVLRIMDWSDSVKDIREEFHKQFMEKYPDIQIEYTQLTIDQYKNTILTAVKSGEAPDLFPVPSGMKLAPLVEEGWFQPLDPYIDDDFKNIFEDGTFQNGITMIDDQIYSIPEAAPMPSSLVFYNKKLFEEAGLDPESPPKTYSELKEYAKKITEAGNGQYYGFIEGGKQSARWLETIRGWASLAGAGLNGNSPINLATNEPTYDSEEVLGIFDLFSDMSNDGSFHPKTMSISAPEARALFGQGQAAFLVQGAWCIGVWNTDNPDLEYGVMAPPTPDSGRKGSIPIPSVGAWIGLSKDSKHPEEAALYLKEYYGGDYFQKARVEQGDAFSVVKDINEKYANVEQLSQYYEIVQEYGRTVPDPIVRNPDTANVFVEYKDVNPSIGELLGGVIAGAIKDPKSGLTKYSNDVDAAWDHAIKAAQNKEIDVDSSDFIFENWDPMENYTSRDYEALD